MENILDIENSDEGMEYRGRRVGERSLTKYRDGIVETRERNTAKKMRGDTGIRFRGIGKTNSYP